MKLFAVLFTVAFLASRAGIVSAVDFANLPPGLEAKKIVEQQYQKLFPRSKPGYNMECVRGEPTPWFKVKTKAEKSRYFKKLSDTDALEAIVTTDGDSLTIFNGGCEYYVIGFRYESPKKAHDKKDRRWWFQKTVKALERARELGADSVFDLKKSIQTINRLAKDKKFITDIVEEPVEGEGVDFLQTRISITNYGSLPQQSGSFVELELFTGPL